MILVTGGAGYIGSHFIKTYLTARRSEEVIVVDDLSQGHKESLLSLTNVRFFQQSIGDVNGMKRLFSQFPIEAVVHFASSLNVGESQNNPGKYLRNNVVESINLFQSMEESMVRKIIFSSSCATYGLPVRNPIDENHPQAPINVYGITKLMVEQALRIYSETRGWSFVALRYFNASGADASGTIGESHSPETHLIPLALQATLGKRVLEIYGDDYDTPDGTCIRDYVHVTDLARAHCQALALLSKPGGQAINIGTTCGASVKEVVQTCRLVTGLDLPMKISPRRPGDPPVLVADAGKAKALLGWSPQYSLKRTIETAWIWESNRRY